MLTESRDSILELGSVSIWLNELKTGDEQAATAIFNRYFSGLRSVARNHLQGFPTRIADDEDLALEVIHTLFEGMKVGRFDNMKNRNHLWGLLVVMTRQEVINHKRTQTRAKRDVGREEVVDSPDLCDSDPNPQKLVEHQDFQQHLFEILRNDQLRRIAAAKLFGNTNAEIAERENIRVRSVQRKINKIYDCWNAELAARSEASDYQDRSGE